MGTVTRIPDGMLLGQDFAAFMRESEPQAKVLPAASFRDAYRAYRADPERAALPTMPWAKTHANFQFRPGEVTLWAGTNGSGKSMVTSHVALGLMEQGVRVVTQSFEMAPMKQLDRFIRQFSACRDFTPQAEARFFDWAHGKLWFYDQQGTAKAEMVVAVCRYAAQRLGATHVIVDSLMKVVRGEDDYNRQKEFVDMLTAVARDHGMHIHLVHHAKKLDDESRVPSKADAKGAGAITDLVDNVIMVWRNKPKEALLEAENQGVRLTDKERTKLEAPDVILVCDKQRNHDWEGRIALWFNRESWQYIGDSFCRSAPMGARTRP